MRSTGKFSSSTLAYLMSARELPRGESQIFEIGCEDIEKATTNATR